MKYFLLISALLCTSLVFSQTIRRVNPTSGVSGVNVYATFDAAYAAAVDGDIIQLEPSNSANYDAIVIGKKLTIIGIGYNLASNTNTFFDKRTPKINYLTLAKGSSGSVIMGLEITSIVNILDSKIKIQRCKIGQIYVDPTSFGITSNDDISGTILSQNLFTGPVNLKNWATWVGPNKSSGHIIINNIFSGDGAFLTGIAESTISYNTFYTKSSVLRASGGCNFTNNIIDARGATTGFTVVGTDATAQIANNLCSTVGGLPSGSGNVNSANATSIFTVADPWTAFLETNVQLSATSPARTVGVGSTPIGAYASTSPYIPSGVPNTPVITSFSVNGVTPLNVSFTIRSSN
ncbi:hypothetical protein [Arcicella rigui]|uniref:Right handed beta helix domain-containing protein n=1 Tax=Arcicella rigui TaxID=797020 RepID=A0ABU5QAN3_9BACT|nr:hypothetical protein [Arcicella rigui]MEA5139904.1 hypothetical protein [Arcicella rigui]